MGPVDDQGSTEGGRGAGTATGQTSWHAFISHSSRDREKAERICSSLEARGLRCWIAPRDVRPGREYAEEIIDGIQNSRCLVLVLSAAANGSQMVRREVERAVSAGKPVFPVRVEEVLPARGLELFVSVTHWIDAWQGELTNHADRLADELMDEHALRDVVAEVQGRRRRRALFRRLSTSSVLVVVMAIVALVLALKRPAGGQENLDPVRTEAQRQGVDIDDITAKSFEIELSTGLGKPSLEVMADDAAKKLIGSNLVEYRVGKGQWKMLYDSPMSEAAMGLLETSDLESKGPVELQLSDPSTYPRSRTYGPFRYDFSIKDEIVALAKREFRKAGPWAVYHAGYGWTLGMEFFNSAGKWVSSVSYGASPSSLDKRSGFPKHQDPMSRRTDYAAMNSERTANLEEIAANLQGIGDVSTLYCQFEFLDGTRSEVIALDGAAAAATAADEMSMSMENQRRMQNAAALTKFKRSGSDQLSLSHGSLNFSNLGGVASHIDRIEVRAERGQAARTIQIVKGEEDPEDREEAELFELCFGMRFRSNIRVPRHWQQAVVTFRFVDGTSVEQTVTTKAEGRDVGFTATAVGPDAAGAPPLYVTFDHDRFALFPWQERSLGKPRLPDTKIQNVADVLSVEFVSEENGTTTFAYRMDGLSSIAERLPFSPTLERVDATCRFRDSSPVVGVDLSSDGGRMLAIVTSGRVFVIDTATGSTVSSAEIGAKAAQSGHGVLSPDGTRFVKYFQRDRSTELRGDNGAWGLFDALSGRLVAELRTTEDRGPDGGLQVEFSPGGKLLWFRNMPHEVQPWRPRGNGGASVAMARQTAVWSAGDGELILNDAEKANAVLGALSEDRELLVVEQDDRTLRIVDLKSGESRVVKELEARPARVALTSDGSLVAFYYEEPRSVVTYSVPEMRELYRVHSMPGSSGEVPTFSDDGKLLRIVPGLAGCWNEVIDAATGASVFKYVEQTRGFVSPTLAYSQNGGGRGRGVLMKVPGGEAVKYLPETPYPAMWEGRTHCSIVRDDLMVWTIQGPTVTDPKRAYVIDVAREHSKELVLPARAGCMKAVVSRDGEFAAAVLDDGSASVWRVR